MSQSKLSTKAAYFFRSARGRFNKDRRKCPDCGAEASQLIYRKIMVTELRRCEQCQLLFRSPTDPPELNESFYQEEYRSGFTTDCPDARTLEGLVRDEFRGSEKDFRKHIKLLNALGAKPGHARVLDFGASWGYATWQFGNAGYETMGLEISEPRARYAREKLETTVVQTVDELEGQFDVFFSAHVAEHFSAPSMVVDYARKLLRPGGLFVAYTPNGCAEFMEANPPSYHRSWGGVHPSYLDDHYWFARFDDCSRVAASSPVDLDALRNWDQKSDLKLNLTNSELVFAARLPDDGNS